MPTVISHRLPRRRRGRHHWPRTRLAAGLATSLVATAIISASGAQSASGAEPPLVTPVDVSAPPGGSELFGRRIRVLSNGNYAIADPGHDSLAGVDVGAVHLYDGVTNELISTVTGAHAFDQVGLQGLVEVGDSNVVAISSNWDNGSITDAGAVTWIDGRLGLSGTVSEDNSLVGSQVSDLVGRRGVQPLRNGNYVVISFEWDHGDVADAGAVTWGHGNTPTAGPVTAGNSVIGSSPYDNVGSGGVTALTNGNYVVGSLSWNRGTQLDVGAVTWGDGSSGTVGVISPANSLVGSKTSDHAGNSGVTALSNGNYVVASRRWDHGATVDAGAATWGDGTRGISGSISASNSLIGGSNHDKISANGVIALTNGNYVVASSLWDGQATNVGAATWGNGATGTTGMVDENNSLVGTSTGDGVGTGVTALSNGNYVVTSFAWSNGAIPLAGAATWGDGTSGSSGQVSPANSLVGSQPHDRVGANGVAALSNGNYVVVSSSWDRDLVVDAGAATWGDGDGGTNGPITLENSLLGSTESDQIGTMGVHPLANGNYVVASDKWDRSGATNAGAVTWGDGTRGSTGLVLQENSLTGVLTEDRVGYSGIAALDDGNYVVASGLWGTVGANQLGAMTWQDGTAPSSGIVSARNSTTGRRTGDRFASGSIMPLSSGAFLAASPSLHDPATGLIGGMTLGVSTSPTLVSELNTMMVGPTGALAEFIDDAQPTAAGAVPVFWGNQAVRLMQLPDGLHNPPPVDPPPVDPPATQDADVVSLVPARLVETRRGEVTVDGRFEGDGRVGAGSVLRFEVAGRGGVPGSGVSAAVLNVTAVGVGGPGFLTVFPCDADRPLASSLNYHPVTSPVVANEVIAKLSASGEVCVFTHADTDVVVDVVGYAPATAALTSLVPARLVETRRGEVTVDGRFEGDGRLGAGSVLRFAVAGRGGVPGSGVSAAVLNVTAVGVGGPGFLTVFPCDADRPLASSLNYHPVTSPVVANEVIAKLSASGEVCVFTHADTDVVVDVVGYAPATAA